MDVNLEIKGKGHTHRELARGNGSVRSGARRATPAAVALHGDSRHSLPGPCVHPAPARPTHMLPATLSTWVKVSTPLPWPSYSVANTTAAAITITARTTV